MRWHKKANVLFAGSEKGDVYMWRIPDGECKIFLGFGKRTGSSVIFPDGKTLRAKYYRTNTKFESIYPLLCITGKRIAVGYDDGTVRVMDLKTGEIISTSAPGTGHSGAITELDITPNSKLLISGAVDGKTFLRIPQTGVV